MKTYMDCIPCFFKQALEAARLSGANQATEKRIINELAGIIPDFDLALPPPEMGREIYRIVGKITRQEDPYKEIKHKRSNATVNGLFACCFIFVSGDIEVIFSYYLSGIYARGVSIRGSCYNLLNNVELPATHLY